MIISLFSSVSLILVIKPIVVFLYGKDFEEIANVIYIIISGSFLKSVSSLFKAYFSSTGREKINSYTQIIPSILQLVLGFYLIKSFGFYGACFSISIVFTTFSIIYILYFTYITRTKIKNLLPTKSDFDYVFKFFIYKLKVSLRKKVRILISLNFFTEKCNFINKKL